ncbi:TatD family hydrolase [Fusibacter sp. 3D3]|uniref:phosphotriesterase family protein n=1 Tax=Fusibacter sp. 3D3 TaxID=1048380 RepID=UPI0008536646|nr:TatD family hydrolase [Fusibacter sp. 3D3]GAU76021.1 putative aryldialkylphosphatase [Fusibacter sp. 3D3]
MLLERGELSDHDQALLKAAVIASKKTGMPIHCHILEHNRVYDVVHLLEEENADLNKFLWAHADEAGHKETIKFAYDKGLWIGFDMIQVGTYEQKIEYLKEAIKAGQQDRILLSQDYDIHEALLKKGHAHNCTSFFKQFIPYCEERGISKETLINMMTKNPAEFYDVK